MTNRTDFLNGLKVGDEVCYETKYKGIEILKVVRITPKRMFVLPFGVRVNKDGSIVGEPYNYIREVREEDRKKVSRYQMIRYIAANLDLDDLTNDELNNIYKIVKQS